LTIPQHSNNLQDQNPNLFEFSWHPLPCEDYDPKRHVKGWRTFQTDDVNRLARAMIKCAWSPIIWRHAYKIRDNFSHAYWLALDFDGTENLYQMAKDWCDSVSVIGTTKRHSEKEHRFRLAFQLSRPIVSLDEYFYNMEKLSEKYNIDEQCLGGDRLFFPCKEIYQTISEGYTYDVLDLPDNYCPIKEREFRAYRKYKNLGLNMMFNPYLKYTLKNGAIEGEKNDTCYRVGKYLKFWGMEDAEIIEKVLNSPIPFNNYKSRREAENAVKSGIRKAEKVIEEAKKWKKD